MKTYIKVYDVDENGRVRAEESLSKDIWYNSLNDAFRGAAEYDQTEVNFNLAIGFEWCEVK